MIISIVNLEGSAMNDLRKVFETEKKLLSITGFYPRRDDQKFFYSLCSAFINFSFSYLQLLSMIGQMVVDRRDLSKITDTLLFFMTDFTFLGKLINFLYYRKYLLCLEDDLCKDIFYSFSAKKFEVLQSKIEACKLIAKNFWILCILCIVFYSFLPICLEGNKLPLPGWLPFDVNKYYYQTAIFQIISVSLTAYNNSALDILIWKLITIATGQLQILNKNLEELIYTTDKETEIMFKSCVRHHTEIIHLVFFIIYLIYFSSLMDFFSIVHKIEFIFSKGIFLQFLSSVIIICATGFQLMVVPILSTQFIFLALYIICMMLQVAMYCWYGHEIMITSDKLGQYCYMSNWYDADPKIQKCVTIFLESTKKPIVLTAGNYVELTLPTLTAILRSSYSYFAVLQRLYNET